MENPIVAYLRSKIGHEITETHSPYAKWLRGKVLEVEEGALAAEFTVREEMTNPARTLHGGVAAGILDDIIGGAVFTLNMETFFTSVNLNVDYLAPAKIGDTVIARARVVRKGRNIIHAEGSISHIDGKLIAKGSSNLVVTAIKVG